MPEDEKGPDSVTDIATGEDRQPEPAADQEQEPVGPSLEERIAHLEASIATLPADIADQFRDMVEQFKNMARDMADLQPIVDAVRELQKEEKRPKNPHNSWLHKRLW